MTLTTCGDIIKRWEEENSSPELRNERLLIEARAILRQMELLDSQFDALDARLASIQAQLQEWA